MSEQDFDPLGHLDIHKFSNPPEGLFQDAECTLPATKDGDPVARWLDPMNGPIDVVDGVLRIHNGQAGVGFRR